MSKSAKKAADQAEREKVHKRYSNRREPDVIYPAKKQVDFYDADVHQRVAVYVRVSTDNLGQETSYELQKNYYEEFVLKHPNWKLVKIYADKGISGTSTKHRAELNQKFIDQLVVFRRKQLQNIMQGLEYHLLNGLIFGRIVIIYKLVEPLVSIIFSANQRTHLRLMLKKAFRAIFDIPFRSPVSLKYFLSYLDEFVLAGHGIVNIENINFFGHFLISF